LKKKVLFCGESTWLSTGFATYNKEIITRLFALDKYDIAEMGNYGSANDPRARGLPWKFYGVLPTNSDEEQMYKANPINAFGGYKFDAVVADFQPDIVVSALDPWMMTHIQKSRFRGNFKTFLVPTVDSAPQKNEWISDLFKPADALGTYSIFGKRVLEEAGLSVAEVLSPGVDTQIFKPMSKEAVRSDWGVNKELTIIGTVMRNQKRKLFPDLFQAFALMRNKYRKSAAVGEKTILLCHTSYPDVGWDIPELLKRTQVQRHVIFTYKCDACVQTFFSWFIPCDTNGKALCIFCGKMAAHMPNTNDGVTPQDLAEIYNLMDIYVQPAICEGWGLPIVEAKACGVPGLYQNYSAMEDHVAHGGGLPIKIGRMYTESETMAERSLPDLNSFADSMADLVLSKEKRLKLGKEARDVVERLHTWDVTAKGYERVLDSLKPHNRNYTWDSRPKFKIVPNVTLDPKATDEQFVVWCYRTILNREPDEKGFHDWMNSLKSGRPRRAVEEFFRQEMDSHNRFEEVRWIKSLTNRGIDPNEGLKITSNRLPGMLI
jgi:glycosyltransferase involved in cell wall biosynthesis